MSPFNIKEPPQSKGLKIAAVAQEGNSRDRVARASPPRLAFLLGSVLGVAFLNIVSVGLGECPCEPSSFPLRLYIRTLCTTCRRLAHLARMPDTDAALYWWMLPVASIIAFLANQSGIGGAALFAPIFLLIFPLLGPEYPLHSARAAVSTAILVEVFGFTSGFLGYARRGLIDVRLTLKIAAFSVPSTVLASLLLEIPPIVLKGTYVAFMLLLSAFMLRMSTLPDDSSSVTPVVDEIPVASTSNPLNASASSSTAIASLELGEGKTSTPRIPYPGFSLCQKGGPRFKSFAERAYPFKQHTYLDMPADLISASFSVVGGITTALIGVGLGELMIPRLLHFNVPVEVAAAASVTAVAMTCLSSAIVQIHNEVAKRGLQVRWDLVFYMAAGVILGAQVGTYLQGRLLKKRAMQRVIGLVFLAVGTLFLAIVIVVKM